MLRRESPFCLADTAAQQRELKACLQACNGNEPLTCAGTKQRLKSDYNLARIQAEWDRKRERALTELSDACEAYVPSDKKKIEKVNRGTWKSPIAQCRLDILPAARDGEGILQIEVCPCAHFQHTILKPPHITRLPSAQRPVHNHSLSSCREGFFPFFRHVVEEWDVLIADIHLTPEGARA